MGLLLFDFIASLDPEGFAHQEHTNVLHCAVLHDIWKTKIKTDHHEFKNLHFYCLSSPARKCFSINFSLDTIHHILEDVEWIYKGAIGFIAICLLTGVYPL